MDCTYQTFDFSIMIPTRNRRNTVRNCINSIVSRAKKPENVEVLVVCDFDDSSMQDFSKEMHDNALWNDSDTKLIYRKRVANLNNAYYNDVLAQYVHGRFIWLMNDECEIKTNEWDIILLNSINEFLKDKQDRFLYVSIYDDTHWKIGNQDEIGCCFPILSRESVTELGCFIPGEFTAWGGDTALYQIFTRLPQNRILRLPDVRLEHMSIHTHEDVIRDDVSWGLQTLSLNMETEWQRFRGNISSYVNRLANKIKI